VVERWGPRVVVTSVKGDSRAPGRRERDVDPP
jgi:hypothetical protein